MTAVQALAVVIVRFWAAGAMISWMFSFSLMIRTFGPGNETYGYLQLVSGTAALVFWALILVYSKTVTRWVLPPVKQLDHTFDIEPADIVRIGTFMIGLFYLIRYGFELLRGLPEIFDRFIASGTEVKVAVNWNEAVWLAPHVIAIAVALVLLMRPWLVRAFSWLRHAAPGAAPGDGRKSE